MQLSIVIPAYNESAMLTHTLGQLQQALQTTIGPAGWELIVCDNNSTDDTAEIARTRGATVVCESHRQISRARNRGASVANGEWLLFLDADSYPPPALLSELLALLPDNQCIGGGSTVTVTGGTLFNKLRLERLNPLFRLFNWSGGAFLFCRRDTFATLGGFSTDLYAFEEIDFVIRLKRLGRRRGRRFVVLHRHPVITSGRRGEYQLGAMFTLFLSNFLAVILFGLHYLLPRRWSRWLGRRTLTYWYNVRHS